MVVSEEVGNRLLLADAVLEEGMERTGRRV